MAYEKLRRTGLQPDHALGHPRRNADHFRLSNDPVGFLRQHLGNAKAMMDKLCTQAAFDDCATDYDLHLSQGLAITGESRDYFARGRIAWLTACFRQSWEESKIVTDLGCENGSSTPYLINLPNAPVTMGVDVSLESIKLSTKSHEAFWNHLWPSFPSGHNIRSLSKSRDAKHAPFQPKQIL